MGRITLKMVAEAAGVSTMTVSLCLRNAEKIPISTRERVQRIAEGLGYRPDPALSALVAYRRDVQVKRDISTLAFVTNWKEEDGWKATYVNDFFSAARLRAEQSGYVLEPFWLRAYRSKAHALSVLQARGIQGLLLAPLYRGASVLPLDLRAFSVVAIGLSLLHPNLHVVAHDYFSSTRLALHNLKRLGLTRVAFCLGTRVNSLTEHRIRAAALEYAESGKGRLAVSFCGVEADEPESFLEWVRRHGPDAILSLQPHHQNWLVEAGVKVPEEIGFASLHLARSDTTTSGIVYGAEAIGRASLDLLNTLLQKNEKGYPEWPSRVFVTGKWQAGETVAGQLRPGHKSSPGFVA